MVRGGASGSVEGISVSAELIDAEKEADNPEVDSAVPSFEG